LPLHKPLHRFGSTMAHTITLIPGDGIGPEVAAATCQMIAATGVKIEWETVQVEPPGEALPGEVLSKELIQSLERTRVGLKGPITTPIAEGRASVNVALRKAFELYANVRPIQNIPGVRATHPNIDLIIVRENTEGEYSGIEHEVVPGVVESLKIITERASTRVARFAFEMARRLGRKKIAVVHKANIMKMSDGLFLRCSRRIAGEFPEIEYKEVLVDNACMQLVMNPHQFDVLLLENLYGDIVSDLCAGLVGGLGVVPGANLGDGCAIFEAVHGTAPDIAGKQLANPTALALSAALMLRHLGEKGAADRLEKAIHRVYAEGKHLTPDVGGSATTGEFTRAVILAVA